LGVRIPLCQKDRANIDADELAAFKKLAQAYGRMTEAEVASALDQGDFQELFHDEQSQIQE